MTLMVELQPLLSSVIFLGAGVKAVSSVLPVRAGSREREGNTRSSDTGTRQ